MSRTAYTYRDNATAVIGSYGPLDELDDQYHYGVARRLDPTRDQEIAAGWFNGPNMSNSNAAMILRALDLDPDECSFDAADVLGRIVMARALDSVEDTGMAEITSGNMTVCAIRPGYFGDRFDGIAEVCEVALEWGRNIVFA